MCRWGICVELEKNNVPVRVVNKVHEGRPHIVDMMKNNEIKLIINTVDGHLAAADSYAIRATAMQKGICCITTLAGAVAVVSALVENATDKINALQDLY